MKELPTSNLEQHLKEVHQVHVFPSPDRNTASGRAERAAAYVANDEMHSRIHGGHHLARPSGEPQHIHKRYVA